MLLIATMMAQMQRERRSEQRESKRLRVEQGKRDDEQVNRLELQEQNRLVRQRNHEREEKKRLAQLVLEERLRSTQLVLEDRLRSENATAERERREHELTMMQGRRGRAPLYLSMKEGIDLEAYFNGFRAHMKNNTIPKSEWPQNLLSVMSQSIREIYDRMDEGEQLDFDRLTQAVLREFHVTPENHRRKLDGLEKSDSQSWPAYEAERRLLGRKWLQNCVTREDVVDCVLKEELLKQMPGYLAGAIRDKKPVLSRIAAQLAAEYKPPQKRCAVEPAISGRGEV